MGKINLNNKVKFLKDAGFVILIVLYSYSTFQSYLAEAWRTCRSLYTYAGLTK